MERKTFPASHTHRGRVPEPPLEDPAAARGTRRGACKSAGPARELERGAAGKKGGPETAHQLVEGEGTMDHQAIANHLISMPAFQDAA
jgi:hypothetical protein